MIVEIAINPLPAESQPMDAVEERPSLGGHSFGVVTRGVASPILVDALSSGQHPRHSSCWR
jgi:hypothetical protein